MVEPITSWSFAVVVSHAWYAILQEGLRKAQQSDAVWDHLQEVLDPMQPSGTQLPVFMGGQSMGGMLTILTVLRDQAAWQVVHFLHASLSQDGLLFKSSPSYLHHRHPV